MPWIFRLFRLTHPSIFPPSPSLLALPLELFASATSSHHLSEATLATAGWYPWWTHAKLHQLPLGNLGYRQEPPKCIWRRRCVPQMIHFAGPNSEPTDPKWEPPTLSHKDPQRLCWILSHHPPKASRLIHVYTYVYISLAPHLPHLSCLHVKIRICRKGYAFQPPQTRHGGCQFPKLWSAKIRDKGAHHKNVVWPWPLRVLCKFSM